MTKELFIKLNQLLSEATPTKIIKRGNAFSTSELSEKEIISTEFKKFTFDGLNIYQSHRQEEILLLKGECFFAQSNTELEMESEIYFPYSIDLNDNFRIQEFIFDLSESSIFLKIERTT